MAVQAWTRRSLEHPISLSAEELCRHLCLPPSMPSRWRKRGCRGCRPYVLPDKYVVKLTDAELGVEPPKGILFVKLIEASNVPRMDMLSKSDPYVM